MPEVEAFSAFAPADTGDPLKGNDAQAVRSFVGVGILIGGVALPTWHIMPFFLNLKIAADPALPQLTTETLPIATTAIFIGWLISAVCLERAMEVFNKQQLIVIHVFGLCLVAVASVLLPYLTAGNFILFTLVRFAQGLFMNITALQCMYVQDNMPQGQGNQALVVASIAYSVAAIFMVGSFKWLTFAMDWRLETLLWCVPALVGLKVAFPNCSMIIRSLPATFRKMSYNEGFPEVEKHETMPLGTWRNLIAMAISFMACGCGFFDLTYSAGQLSSDACMSCMLLHGADIIGYTFALSADKYGRNTVQAGSFFLAAGCLLLCSVGTPGGALVLSSAIIGRLCVDVCFTTVYVGLAEIFTGSSQKIARTVCETTARLGAVLAPFSGTWPPSISCPIFASLCLAAGCASLTLPPEEQLESFLPEETH